MEDSSTKATDEESKRTIFPDNDANYCDFLAGIPNKSAATKRRERMELVRKSRLKRRLRAKEIKHTAAQSMNM